MYNPQQKETNNSIGNNNNSMLCDGEKCVGVFFLLIEQQKLFLRGNSLAKTEIIYTKNVGTKVAMNFTLVK